MSSEHLIPEQAPTKRGISALSELLDEHRDSVNTFNMGRRKANEKDPIIENLFKKGIAITGSSREVTLDDVPDRANEKIILTRQEPHEDKPDVVDITAKGVYVDIPIEDEKYEGDEVTKTDATLFKIRGTLGSNGEVTKTHIAFPQVETAKSLDTLLLQAETVVTLFEKASEENE